MTPIDPHRDSPRAASQRTRWALLLVALVASIAFVGSSWAQRARAASLTETFALALVERVAQDLRPPPGELPGPPSQAQLDQTLARFSSDGLQAIVIVTGAGEVLASAGSRSHLPIAQSELRPHAPARILGGLVRLALPKPPPHRSHGPEGRGPPPEGRGPPMDLHRPTVFIEIESTLARVVLREADRSLAISLVCSAVLLAFALWSARASSALEQAEAQQTQRERLAVMGSMSAVIAHELRNPLAALKGQSQLLLESLREGDPAHDRALRVMRSATRLERLSNALLAFVREVPPANEPVDLVELCDELSIEHDGKVLMESPETLWVRGDRAQLHMALRNIIDNALRAKSPTVELRLQTRGDRVELRIEDRGEGVPDDVLPKIFQAFYTTRSTGVGLGLAIVARIVAQHHGAVTAKHREGGGLSITVELPLLAHPA
ncbi:MAG: ATP-binding protein [Deltaproteobacteria bacterium]|nr:ATP-binding protein [Deltaproteobacteria bacterium]